LIFNKFEGQLDSGKLMHSLLQKVLNAGVKILNSITVEDYSEKNTQVEVKTNMFSFNTGRLLIATNGFASQMGIKEIKPARAQVLITKPIKNLNFKGTFHIDRGYYYFRNIDGRVLLGGGRNLDFETEETLEMGQNASIQNRLEELLNTTILSETEYEIERRWTGIMGMGTNKNPLVKQISNNVFCGVGLSGIGIAIGSQVGIQLAGLPD
jgi:glycine/D-amino acid oxidase-like deaminating enzyme